LNIAYTDKKGNSGVAVAAGIPNRKPGHTGMFVVPGDGTYDYDLIPND
jgi:acyl-homoserine lactone acylase PvdQ